MLDISDDDSTDHLSWVGAKNFEPFKKTKIHNLSITQSSRRAWIGDFDQLLNHLSEYFPRLTNLAIKVLLKTRYTLNINDQGLQSLEKCSSLKSVSLILENIPKSLTDNGLLALQKCSSLTSLDLGRAQCFSNDGLKRFLLNAPKHFAILDIHRAPQIRVDDLETAISLSNRKITIFRSPFEKIESLRVAFRYNAEAAMKLLDQDQCLKDNIIDRWSNGGIGYCSIGRNYPNSPFDFMEGIGEYLDYLHRYKPTIVFA